MYKGNYNVNIISRVALSRYEESFGLKTKYNIENYKTFDKLLRHDDEIIGLCSTNVTNSFFKVVANSKYKYLMKPALSLLSKGVLHIGVTDAFLLKNLDIEGEHTKNGFFYFITEDNHIIALFVYEGENKESIPILDTENALDYFLHTILSYIFRVDYKKFISAFEDCVLKYYIDIFTHLDLDYKEAFKFFTMIMLMNIAMVEKLEFDPSMLIDYCKMKQLEGLEFIFSNMGSIDDNEFNNDFLIDIKDAIYTSARDNFDITVSMDYESWLYDFVFITWQMFRSQVNMEEFAGGLLNNV